MMSVPPGKTNKKILVQTRLPLTYHGSSSRNQASGSSSATPGKGLKRKLDTGSEGAVKRFNMHQLQEHAAAASKERIEDSKSESEASSRFANKNNGLSKPRDFTDNLRSKDEAGPSTAAEDPNTDTPNYERSGSNDSDFQDSQSHNSLYEDGDEDRIPCGKPSTSDGGKHCKGKPLDELNATTKKPPHLGNLEASNGHIVFVKTPFKYTIGVRAEPHPSTYQDKWDNHHVRMPCSDQNEYPTENGTSTQRRWGMIKSALSKEIRGSFELEEAILKYNQRYVNKWHFNSLRHFISKIMKKEERETFFNATLPLMVSLALKLPQLCTKAIPLLKKGMNKQLTLSQEQIACLLANAFFCTFPRRNSRAPKAEYSTYPDINFNSLFQGEPVDKKMHKLRCIFHYFTRVLQEMPTGLMTFTRQGNSETHGINWWGDMSELTDLHVSSAGTIEDNGRGMLQVDFANKYLGGGVLGHGCVQEEIRFLICPELIVSRLFTEVLDDNESLIMTGCEQYSRYDGYADNFRWAGDYQDNTQRDDWGRRCTEIVAIDALVFRGEYKRQFRSENVCRELNKAFCGFKTNKIPERDRPAVCTGNWGCGAFGGDKELKALIQLMAASCAKRDMCYFTFGDNELVENLHLIHDLLQRKRKIVGDVMKLIDRYGKSVVNRYYSRSSCSLFDFIHECEEGKSLRERRQQYSNSFNDDSNGAPGSWEDPGKESPDYKAGTP